MAQIEVKVKLDLPAGRRGRRVGARTHARSPQKTANSRGCKHPPCACPCSCYRLRFFAGFQADN